MDDNVWRLMLRDGTGIRMENDESFELRNAWFRNSVTSEEVNSQTRNDYLEGQELCACEAA